MGDIQKALFDEKLETNYKNNYKFTHKLSFLKFPIITIKQSEYEKTVLLFQKIPIIKTINLKGFTNE